MYIWGLDLLIYTGIPFEVKKWLSGRNCQYVKQVKANLLCLKSILNTQNITYLTLQKPSLTTITRVLYLLNPFNLRPRGILGWLIRYSVRLLISGLDPKIVSSTPLLGMEPA